MWLLLDAWAKTLGIVIVMLDPTELRGEKLSLKDMQVLTSDFAARGALTYHSAGRFGHSGSRRHLPIAQQVGVRRTPPLS